MNPPENVNTDPEFIKAKELQGSNALKFINASIGDSFSERAFGCIMGAFVGDACGSYIEFDEEMPGQKKLDDAMKMLGGGYFGCIAGQVTDDSEMMMSLMQGYIDSNEDIDTDAEKVVNYDKIGARYGSWYNTMPFDIGRACETSIKVLSYDNRCA